jgi:hypothetical protein
MLDREEQFPSGRCGILMDVMRRLKRRGRAFISAGFRVPSRDSWGVARLG